MMSSQVMQSSVSSSSSGRVSSVEFTVASVVLQLRVVVSIEEGGRQVARGHGSNFLFSVSSLIKSLAEVLVNDPRDLSNIMSVENNISRQVLSCSVQVILPITLPLLLTGWSGGDWCPGVWCST